MFEIIAIAVAFLTIGGVVFGIRRASEKQLPKEKQRPSLPEKADQRVSGRKTHSDAEPAIAKSPTPEGKELTQPVSEEPAQDVEPDAPEEKEAELPEEPEDSQEDAYRKGLKKTKGGFVTKLSKLFSKKQLDEDLLDSVEEVLFTADIGPKTAQKLLSGVKGTLSKAELTDGEKVWNALVDQSTALVTREHPPIDFAAHKPFVLLMIGVNGVGKTTTIGKITAKLKAEGKSVLLAAGDTFRAAAVEQLEVWGERSGVEVVKGKSGSDPSSVIFEAIKQGARDGIDVVIADTAGRLHTKVDLMDELKKISRVCDKANPGAPHETWIVLDATTGQNAIQQAQIFKDASNLSGIVLTKLDGTAKGGVILGICDQLDVPVRYVGVGEQIKDLRPFDPSLFVSSLFDRDEASSGGADT